mmetsp:Transcript_29093/g.96646  ORF Transcript_29093/g.96646 Transcript_29093/m.96646 type:complete len:294 (-) Transcript_29093:1816-2697(-)
MFAQNAAQPSSISSTRFSSCRARSSDAAECDMASAADGEDMPRGSYRTTALSSTKGTAVSPGAPPTAEEASEKAPGRALLLCEVVFSPSMRTSSATSSPSPTEEGRRNAAPLVSKLPTDSTLGSCEGTMPGDMKSNSSTSLFQASQSPLVNCAPEMSSPDPPALTPAPTPPPFASTSIWSCMARAPVVGWPCMRRNCSKSCLVQWFMDSGRLSVDGRAATGSLAGAEFGLKETALLAGAVEDEAGVAGPPRPSGLGPMLPFSSDRGCCSARGEAGRKLSMASAKRLSLPSLLF